VKALFLRNAEAPDLPSIRALVEADATAPQWSGQHYRELLAGAAPRVALVAEESGEVRGAVVALATGDEWEIENIVVAESRRRRGVGKQLLRTVLARARERRAARVFLEVRAANAAARALYRELGFVEAGRRAGYYQNPPDGAIIYSINVAAATLESS